MICNFVFDCGCYFMARSSSHDFHTNTEGCVCVCVCRGGGGGGGGRGVGVFIARVGNCSSAPSNRDVIRHH